MQINKNTFDVLSGTYKVPYTSSEFGNTADARSYFASSVAVADMDADGVDDVLVGAPYAHDGNTSSGAVWILLMNDDMTIKSKKKLVLPGNISFAGSAIAVMDDRDGNGTRDIAVSFLEK